MLICKAVASSFWEGLSDNHLTGYTYVWFLILMTNLLMSCQSKCFIATSTNSWKFRNTLTQIICKKFEDKISKTTYFLNYYLFDIKVNIDCILSVDKVDVLTNRWLLSKKKKKVCQLKAKLDQICLSSWGWKSKQRLQVLFLYQLVCLFAVPNRIATDKVS